MRISSRYKNVSSNFRRYVQTPDGMPEINGNLYNPHGSYKEKLFDRRWLEKREKILKRDLHTCRNCGSEKNLEVHHRQYHFIAAQNSYKEPWDYDDELLVTLCKPCNQKGRNKFKIPTKII